MTRQRSILIVEDDHELRRLLRHALGLAGYSVSESSDGINALQIIEQHRPDLIVLDLGLPMLSGLDVQQEIAAHAETRDIPVVIVTGSSAPLDGIGVACVLRKPVLPDEVVATVTRCFAVHAKRDTA